MNEKLKVILEGERDHSMFLEELLAALYGPGWDKLTIYEAKKWRKRHLTSRRSRAAGACDHQGKHATGWMAQPRTCGTTKPPPA